EVEGVRHSDQPESADRSGYDVVAHDLDPDSARKDECRRRQLCADLPNRREAEDIVYEPCEIEDRAAAENAAELTRRRNEARCECDACGGEEPGDDSAAPQERRRARVPAVIPRPRNDVTR